VATPNLQIQAFWQWFIDHLDEFNRVSKPEEPFWALALEQIKKVDERFWFELSARGDEPREFIVTAEGHVEAFPIAEELISLAPEIGGWSFVALKPPMGFAFTTQYEGTLFEPQKMWFLPMGNPTRPQDIGLRVGIPGLKSIDERVAGNALLVILDTGLGERSAALDIQYLQVAELPPDPEPLGYMELQELPDYISWCKRERSSGSGGP
jgi:hypothetical protein